MVLLCACGFAGAHQRSSTAHFVLGEGRSDGLYWTSSIRAPARISDPSEPCISISTERGRKLGELQQCAVINSGNPLLEIVPTGPPGRLRRTVVVAAFVAVARRLYVDLGRAGHRTVHLRRVSDAKAKQIGIRPIAYWAQAFVGHFCLHRVSAYNALGEQLSDSGPLRCQ